MDAEVRIGFVLNGRKPLCQLSPAFEAKCATLPMISTDTLGAIQRRLVPGSYPLHIESLTGIHIDFVSASPRLHVPASN
jgi:hypothetical protein